MYPFRRLAVWEKAHALTLRCFQVTESVTGRRFPGLVAQFRRAVASIPANIAEGAGHSTDPQFNRFLEIAIASSLEADYHLLLARDLGVISGKDYAQLEARLSEVRQMLTGLRKRVLERMRLAGTRREGERPTRARRTEAVGAERAERSEM
ncbi:MAG: four helix bundle protein [Gemmatimonadaceae bacterium]